VHPRETRNVRHTSVSVSDTEVWAVVLAAGEWCPDWARGPGASLRCGLAALPPTAEAAVVVLGDGPDLAPEAIDRVIARRQAADEPVVAATYAGTRLHPVLIAREAWAFVPDEGAKGLDAELVPCDDLGPPGDVDFASDVPDRLKSWSASDP
jgi:CTP:molybdopterin cytidylyltransferase MocA